MRKKHKKNLEKDFSFLRILRIFAAQKAFRFYLRLKGWARMRIRYLADNPEIIPVLGVWIYDEWSFLYPGKTAKYIESLLRRRLNKNKLPLTLVAFQAQKPVGTVSLKASEMRTRRRLSPWVTSLYVTRPRRKKGIGSKLMKAVEQKAAELSYSKIYLFTVDELVPFYSRLGWNRKEKTTYHSYDVTIMEKRIECCS